MNEYFIGCFEAKGSSEAMIKLIHHALQFLIINANELAPSALHSAYLLVPLP